MKNKKKRSFLKIVLIAVVAVAAFCGIAAVVGLQRSASRKSGGYANSSEVRSLEGDETIGRVEISTFPMEEGLPLRRGSFLFTGEVIYMLKEGQESVYCVCDGDGANPRELWRGDGSSGSRLLPFSDNRRVLLGDCVLECPEGETFSTCEPGTAVIIPINFPEEFSADKAVVDTWTEVIIAPDCEHFAWTIRRSDCGAVNAMGRLVRTETAYEIVDAEYISNMNTFTENENGELSYTEVIGGEVKQFVHGGREISLVGSNPNGMADSVLQNVATGEVTLLTHAPGYDETTLLSPDERLGVVMTSRFSEATDPAVMGLVERPYGQALHNILGQVYMYSVTGVRSGREGNVGPALIDLETSMNDESYTGIDLSDPEEEWVFNSPLSWNEDGTRVMWMENEKNGTRIRLQVAELLDYEPGEIVQPDVTPEVGDYAAAPRENMDYSGRISGKVSGYVEVEKKTGFLNKTTVTVTYHDYSDDGEYRYNGSESSTGSIMTKTVYTADLTVTDADGNVCGSMDADMRFSAAYKLTSFFTGSTTPELDTAKSSGTAEWNGVKADISGMVK